MPVGVKSGKRGKGGKERRRQGGQRRSYYRSPARTPPCTCLNGGEEANKGLWPCCGIPVPGRSDVAPPLLRPTSHRLHTNSHLPTSELSLAARSSHSFSTCRSLAIRTRLFSSTSAYASKSHQKSNQTKAEQICRLTHSITLTPS